MTSVLGDGEEALDVGMVTHLVLCMSFTMAVARQSRVVRPAWNQSYNYMQQIISNNAHEQQKYICSHGSLFSWLSFWRHAEIALKSGEAMAYLAHPVATAMFTPTLLQ